jgi:hypothetical protein
MESITSQQIKDFTNFCKQEDYYIPANITEGFVKCIGTDTTTMDRSLMVQSRVMLCTNSYKLNPIREMLEYLFKYEGDEKDIIMAIILKLAHLETTAAEWTNSMVNVLTRGIWKHALDQLETVSRGVKHYLYRSADGKDHKLNVIEALKKYYCGSMMKTYPLIIEPFYEFAIVPIPFPVDVALDDATNWHSEEVKRPLFLVEMTARFHLSCPAFKDANFVIDPRFAVDDVTMSQLFVTLNAFTAYVPFFDRNELSLPLDMFKLGSSLEFTFSEWDEDYGQACENLGDARVGSPILMQTKLEKKIANKLAWKLMMENR